MNKIIKRIIITLLIIGTLGLASYGGYTLYNIAVEDAALRIKARVAEGVAEGASKSVRNILNPFSWFKGIFGRKKKSATPKPEVDKTAPADEQTPYDNDSDD